MRKTSLLITFGFHLLAQAEPAELSIAPEQRPLGLTQVPKQDGTTTLHFGVHNNVRPTDPGSVKICDDAGVTENQYIRSYARVLNSKGTEAFVNSGDNEVSLSMTNFFAWSGSFASGLTRSSSTVAQDAVTVLPQIEEAFKQVLEPYVSEVFKEHLPGEKLIPQYNFASRLGGKLHEKLSNANLDGEHIKLKLQAYKDAHPWLKHATQNMGAQRIQEAIAKVLHRHPNIERSALSTAVSQELAKQVIPTITDLTADTAKSILGHADDLPTAGTRLAQKTRGILLKAGHGLGFGVNSLVVLTALWEAHKHIPTDRTGTKLEIFVDAVTRKSVPLASFVVPSVPETRATIQAAFDCIQNNRRPSEVVTVRPIPKEQPTKPTYVPHWQRYSPHGLK